MSARKMQIRQPRGVIVAVQTQATTSGLSLLLARGLSDRVLLPLCAIRDVWALAATCHGWRACVAQDLVWTRLFARDFGATDPAALRCWLAPVTLPEAATLNLALASDPASRWTNVPILRVHVLHNAPLELRDPPDWTRPRWPGTLALAVPNWSTALKREYLCPRLVVVGPRASFASVAYVAASCAHSGSTTTLLFEWELHGLQRLVAVTALRGWSGLAQAAGLALAAVLCATKLEGGAPLSWLAVCAPVVAAYAWTTLQYVWSVLLAAWPWGTPLDRETRRWARWFAATQDEGDGWIGLTRLCSSRRVPPPHLDSRSPACSRPMLFAQAVWFAVKATALAVLAWCMDCGSDSSTLAIACLTVVITALLLSSPLYYVLAARLGPSDEAETAADFIGSSGGWLLMLCVSASFEGLALLSVGLRATGVISEPWTAALFLLVLRPVARLVVLRAHVAPRPSRTQQIGALVSELPLLLAPLLLGMRLDGVLATPWAVLAALVCLSCAARATLLWLAFFSTPGRAKRALLVASLFRRPSLHVLHLTP